MNRLLYFVYNRYTGLIKVGVSNNFINRLGSLECAAGVRLDTLGTLEGGADLEGAIHTALFDSREVGEWFRPTEDLLSIARNPTRQLILELIEARRPVVQAHNRAIEEATREERQAEIARKEEEKRRKREEAKRLAAEKVEKERKAAERKRRKIEREAERQHAEIEAWQKKSVDVYSTHGLPRAEPIQRLRNMQLVGLAGSERTA